MFDFNLLPRSAGKAVADDIEKKCCLPLRRVDVKLLEAVQKRKSIRDFKSEPVSRELLEKVLEMAVRAPSGVNRQPWKFSILSGEVLAKVKEKNLEMFQAGHKGYQGAGPSVAGTSTPSHKF